MGDAHSDQDYTCDYAGVNSVFYCAEDGDQNSGHPDDVLERRYPPKRVHLTWFGDEVSHCVNNDGGQPSSRDPIECGGQAIECNYNYDSGENTSQRRADTGLGFESRSRE